MTYRDLFHSLAEGTAGLFFAHSLYMKTAGKYMKKKLNKYNKCISYCFYMKNIINNKIIEKKSQF